MKLPTDGHTHSEWSWDAKLGSMDGSCAQAVALGLPAIAFTEHVDFTPFEAGHLAEDFGPLVHDGILTAPPFDANGYFRCVEACRAKYPDLLILTGIEAGQPHRHREQISDLLDRGQFDRIIGSLHCLPDSSGFAEPFTSFPRRSPADAVRDYLAEIPRMVAGSGDFTVLGHIDYPVRSWPAEAGPFDPREFADEFRSALRAVAETERALEINTKVPLDPVILDWWRAAGGQRVTFGSDGHEPWTIGRGLAEAAAMAEAHGFRPDRRPDQPWTAVTAPQ